MYAIPILQKRNRSKERLSHSPKATELFRLRARIQGGAVWLQYNMLWTAMIFCLQPLLGSANRFISINSKVAHVRYQLSFSKTISIWGEVFHFKPCYFLLSLVFLLVFLWGGQGLWFCSPLHILLAVCAWHTVGAQPTVSYHINL